MRIQAYIRLVGDESTIRAFHQKTRVLGASIRQLKAPRDSSPNEMWWDWQTDQRIIDSANPDDGLKAFLKSHAGILPMVKEFEREGRVDAYLEVVSRYDEGEEPQGLYLSVETLQLLCDMGGALDNDVVIAREK